MKVQRKKMALALGSVFVGVSGLGVFDVSYAQQAEVPKDQPQKIEKIQVTGSNIKRVDVETAAPIDVITREDIDRSGKQTVSQLLQDLLPSNNANAITEMGTGSVTFTPGASAVSLRGLGPMATLLLINGRRVAPYGFAGSQSIFADLNSIPLAVVERVEVLKDGASAIYGSEAMAGVINVILRKDYTGVELAGNMSSPTQKGGGDAKSFNVSAGFGDLGKDRFNAFASFEHREQKELFIKDRPPYTSRDLRGIGYLDRRSTYSYPGNFLDLNGRFLATNQRPGQPCPEGIGSPGTNLVGRCLRDVYQWYSTIPQAKHDSIYTKGSFDFSENLSAFAELGFVRNKVRYWLDPQSFYTDEVIGAILLPRGYPGNPYNQDVYLRYNFRELGAREAEITSENTRGVLGLKGSLANWDWESAVVYTKSNVTDYSTNLINKVNLQRLIDNRQYVFGNPDANPAGTLDQFRANTTRRGSAINKSWDLKASHDLMDLPAGPLGFAAGVEYRKEEYSDIPDDLYTRDEIFGSVENPTQGSRNVTSAYFELNVPVLKNLESQFALRTDKFSDYGRSTTPKVGVKWTPSKMVAVRGTYAEGFRAPSFRELGSLGKGFRTISDPLRCIKGDEPDCDNSVNVVSGGNPNLRPEESKSYTLGFVFEPSALFNATVDYYDIKRSEEITPLDYTFLLANEASYPGYVRRDGPGGVIRELYLPFLNIAATRTKGLDFGAKIKIPLAEWGKLGFNANWNHVLSWKQAPTKDDELLEYNGTYIQPRNRGNLVVTWDSGDWAFNWRTNYVGKFETKQTPYDKCNQAWVPVDGCQVKSWTTVDFFLRYSGFKNLLLTFAVDNVQNKRPPLDFRSIDNGWNPYNTNYHNVVGRVLSVGAEYKFK